MLSVWERPALIAAFGRPKDSAKTRMQSQRKEGGQLKYTSTLQTLAHVAKTEGVPSLWKGFMPYFARSGTHTVSLSPPAASSGGVPIGGRACFLCAGRLACRAPTGGCVRRTSPRFGMPLGGTAPRS